MIAPETTDCAVFVTHIWSPRIARHFERLRREAGTVLPVFLAFHQTDKSVDPPEGMSPDIVVRNEDAAAVTPYRFQDHVARGSLATSGYVDIVWITILLDRRLAAFERLWLIEYDVDFSGDWASLFGPLASRDGDLLAAYVRTKSQHPHWPHWPSLSQPSTGPVDPTAAFMPISRYSRKLLETARQVLAVPGWQGHLEVVLPSLAMAHGFTVVDIDDGGVGGPRRRLGHYYTADFANSETIISTHSARPRGFSYFVDWPWLFRRPDTIYHPVKTELPRRMVAEIRKTLWRQRLRHALPPAVVAFIRRVRPRS